MVLNKITANCPNMHAQVDMAQIREVLNNTPGIGRVNLDLANHSMVIFSANQDRGRNVLLQLSHAGFPLVDYRIEELQDHPKERVVSSHS